MSALYLNGSKVVNGFVPDGAIGGITTILDGEDTTNKWAEPLVYDDVNILNYDLLCFKGKDQNNSFNLYYHIADLPISPNPTSDNNSIQFSANGYLYVDANGYMYFCVTTTKTLVMYEIIVC